MAKFNLTIDQLILELVSKTSGQIGREYGVSTTTVTNRIKKLGLGHLITKQKKELDETAVVERYKNGESARSISIELKVDYRTIRRILKSHEVTIIHPGIRTYVLNENVFECIDTPEKAYWVGFLLADGHLSSKSGIQISLAKYDDILLKRFASFVGCDDPNLWSSPRRHPKAMFNFQSKKMGKDLRDKGFDDWKDGTSQVILDSIPDYLFHHFVRGYFDGDGSISYQRIRLKSGLKGHKMHWTASIVCKFENHLRAIGSRLPIATWKVKERTTIFTLLFSNKSNVRSLGEYIYQDVEELFLDRKKVRFDILNDMYPFFMKTIHDFYIPRGVDRLSIVDQFTECLLRTGWKTKRDSFTPLLEKTIDSLDAIIDDELKIASNNPDNALFEHCQPWINWIKLGNSTPIADFRTKPGRVRRGVQAFLERGSLNPERLVREMKFVGFCRASLLSAGTIIRAVRHFKLSGSWFDPCAGWGNRLLAAYYLNIPYSACDPGISFSGLEYLNDKLDNFADLQKLPWQEAAWQKSDFVLTSPPFYNKEDYLDGTEYGKFDDWCDGFLKPLTEKSLNQSEKVLFHTDERMAEYLMKLGGVPHQLIIPSRSKSSKEFFVLFER